MEANRLREIRIFEGITISELARLSGVSNKVISETERMLRNPKLETKHKIIKGLNAARSQDRPPYKFSDVFIEEQNSLDHFSKGYKSKDSDELS